MSFLNFQEEAEENPNAVSEGNRKVVQVLEVAKDQKLTDDLEAIDDVEVTEDPIATEEDA